MKTSQILISTKLLYNFFPLGKFDPNHYSTIVIGNIINIPYKKNINGKILIVYYDFLDRTWIQCKDDNEIYVLDHHSYDFEKIVFYNDLKEIAVYDFEENLFKYAFAFKFDNEHLIPLKFYPFFYENGYTLTQNQIENYSVGSDYEWFFYLDYPKTVLISFNDQVHLNTEPIDCYVNNIYNIDYINNYKNNRHFDFTTLCMRYFNNKYNNIELKNFNIELINSRLSDRNFEKNITCPHCLQNLKNFKMVIKTG